MSHEINIKRIYEPVADDDGYRVLVDRLWPRGVNKRQAAIDTWLRQVAPSPDLRKWFNHKPDRFKEFSAHYRKELKLNPAVSELLDAIAKHKTVTLLYAAHDTENNHAVVLRQYIQQSRHGL